MTEFLYLPWTLFVHIHPPTPDKPSIVTVIRPRRRELRLPIDQQTQWQPRQLGNRIDGIGKMKLMIISSCHGLSVLHRNETQVGYHQCNHSYSHSHNHSQRTQVFITSRTKTRISTEYHIISYHSNCRFASCLHKIRFVRASPPVPHHGVINKDASQK